MKKGNFINFLFKMYISFHNGTNVLLSQLTACVFVVPAHQFTDVYSCSLKDSNELIKNVQLTLPNINVAISSFYFLKRNPNNAPIQHHCFD